MNLLNFLEMSFLESVLSCVLAFICLSIFKNIGKFFVRSSYPVFQTVTGFTLFGAISVLSVSFTAGVAKYIIYAGYALSCIVTIIEIIKCLLNKTFKRELYRNIKSFLPVLILYFFFLIKYFILIFKQNGSTDFNCHLTYFSSISQEIFKADYLGRLRVIDVYPFEWSRYHFFNGCVSAIPLALFEKKNLVSFEFAKFLTVSFYMGAIFDIIKINNSVKKAFFSVVSAFGVLIAINKIGIYWPLLTNQYSAIFFLTTYILFLCKSDFWNASVSAILLACSNVHCCITGILLFCHALLSLYFEHNVHKEFSAKSISIFIVRNINLAIYSFLAGLCVFATIFGGTRPIYQSSLSLNFSEGIANFFSFGWLTLVPFANIVNDNSLRGLSFIFPLFYLLWRNIYKIDNFFQKNIKRLITGLILFILFLCFIFIFIRSIPYFKSVLKYIYWFIFIYFIPCICIILNSPKELKIPYFLFLFFGCIQYFIFTAGSSIVNYSLNNIFFIYILLKCLEEDFFKLELKLKTVYFTCFILCCCFILLKSSFKYSFFCGDDDWYHKVISFQPVGYSDIPFEYNNPEDFDLAILNAVKGNRVHYNVPVWGENFDNEINFTSMSRRFIVDK